MRHAVPCAVLCKQVACRKTEQALAECSERRYTQRNRSMLGLMWCVYHRYEHARALREQACQEAAKGRDYLSVLQRFLWKPM